MLPARAIAATANAMRHLARTPDGLRSELSAGRAITDRPIAVNLLLPLARRAHFEAASEADVVVTFWGRPSRPTAKVWIHQCGSVDEALAARSAGADAVIAQGVEAGGHVRGTIPALELLARVRGAVGDGYPILSAGGIAEAELERVYRDAPGQLVHGALEGKESLRRAGSAIGRDRRPVRAHLVAEDIHVGARRRRGAGGAIHGRPVDPVQAPRGIRTATRSRGDASPRSVRAVSGRWRDRAPARARGDGRASR